MLRKLKTNDGSWENFVKDWHSQCETTGNDFTEYFEDSATFQLLEKQCEELQEIPIGGVFSMYDDHGVHTAVCFASGGLTNRIPGEFLRVRHIMIAPKFDADEVRFDDYIMKYAEILSEIVELSKTQIKCPKVKIHFKSRSEMEPIREVMRKLEEESVISSSSSHGLWIVIEP